MPDIDTLAAKAKQALGVWAENPFIRPADCLWQRIGINFDRGIDLLVTPPLASEPLVNLLANEAVREIRRNEHQGGRPAALALLGLTGFLLLICAVVTPRGLPARSDQQALTLTASIAPGAALPKSPQTITLGFTPRGSGGKPLLLEDVRLLGAKRQANTLYLTVAVKRRDREEILARLGTCGIVLFQPVPASPANRKSAR